MELWDTSGYSICGIHTPKDVKYFQEEISIPLSGWRLTDTISTEFLYQDIYELRTFTFVVSLGLLMICLLATFFAIYSQLRPLFKLKEQMQQVMAGNLNAEIATTDSKDEISSLSRTFNNMVTEIGHLIEEIQVTQKRESELRFEMLLAQINPHFLFNTLNSIKWMSVMSGTEHITNTITALGRLLEISMNKVNDVLPIEEELENIKSYIKIQQVRYPGRFDVAYHIEEGILKEHTLKLILQPLVENSILHNIEARDFLMIDISGRCENGIIILQVQDNGTGMDADTMKEILKPKKQGKKGYVFSGLGVSNVQERIQLAYGPDYGLQYDSDGNSFTTVTIRFPQHKAEQNNHPQPIGSSETRTIEQRKRSKERASKRDERCKRKLPFPSRRINHHLLLLLRLPQTEQKRITSLHKQQEYQQCSQQGDYEPPIVLKKNIGIHCEL